MFVASLRTTGAVALVFFLLTITFILLGAATRDHTNVIKWGGYIGLATAVAAWYASFAAVINSTFGRTLVPVFPLRVASSDRTTLRTTDHEAAGQAQRRRRRRSSTQLADG